MRLIFLSRRIPQPWSRTFREALRKAKRSGMLPWREAIDGTRYRVLRGSDAHKDIFDILRPLADQARA